MGRGDWTYRSSAALWRAANSTSLRTPAWCSSTSLVISAERICDCRVDAKQFVLRSLILLVGDRLGVEEILKVLERRRCFRVGTALTSAAPATSGAATLMPMRPRPRRPHLRCLAGCLVRHFAPAANAASTSSSSGLDHGGSRQALQRCQRRGRSPPGDHADSNQGLADVKALFEGRHDTERCRTKSADHEQEVRVSATRTWPLRRTASAGGTWPLTSVSHPSTSCRRCRGLGTSQRREDSGRSSFPQLERPRRTRDDAVPRSEPQRRDGCGTLGVTRRMLGRTATHRPGGHITIGAHTEPPSHG